MGRDDQGVARSRNRHQVIPRTLCFITHDQDVLFLRGGPHKKLWAGLYNGVGGHIEAGEDVYTAARREVREETGLEVQDLRLRAVIHVDTGDPVVGIMLFVFTAEATSRNTVPSPEGSLEWLPRSALPVDQAVEDLATLLPKVLGLGPTDPPLFGAYTYNALDRLVISFAATTT